MSQTRALDCSTPRKIGQPGVLHLKREASGSAHFSDAFAEIFDAHFARLFRYLQRWSGDSELAADAAQETFVRLYERGSMPERPAAWLIAVALNLARNARSTRIRHAQLLTAARGEYAVADRQPLPAEVTEANDARTRVRSTLDRMCARDRSLLLLRAEGFAYRDIAEALELNEASVGTMLARARDTFRQLWEETVDAS